MAWRQDHRGLQHNDDIYLKPTIRIKQAKYPHGLPLPQLQAFSIIIKRGLAIRARNI